MWSKFAPNQLTQEECVKKVEEEEEMNRKKKEAKIKKKKWLILSVLTSRKWSFFL